MLRIGAAYAVTIAKAHAFIDGNKRTALTAATTFLLVNGYQLVDVDQERACRRDGSRRRRTGRRGRATRAPRAAPQALGRRLGRRQRVAGVSGQGGGSLPDLLFSAKIFRKNFGDESPWFWFRTANRAHPSPLRSPPPPVGVETGTTCRKRETDDRARLSSHGATSDRCRSATASRCPSYSATSVYDAYM